MISDAQAIYNQGSALQDQGRLDEAVACYRRALELKPEFAEAQNDLGTACLAQGKLDEAVACFQSALELDPATAQLFTLYTIRGVEYAHG